MQTHKWWRMLSTGMLVLMVLGLLMPSPAATQPMVDPPQATAEEPALCQFPAPSGGEVSVLNAVTGVPYYGDRPAHNTLWAVGYTSRQTIGSPDVATLTLYFNGREWQVVPSPNLAAENVLTGVAAYAANDVWAVGYSYDSATYKPLILHYNGLAWTVWREPTTSNTGDRWDTRLLGVHILAGGNAGTDRPQPNPAAVAVGYTETMHGPMPLALYYNGSSWKALSLPPSMEWGRLTAVTGDSLDDLWAVGTLMDPEGVEAAYLFHRSETGWLPIARGQGTLTSLAVTGDRVFTAGHVHTFTGVETLVMAYTKGSGDWSQIKAFNKPAGENYLTAMTVDGGKVYAVGYADDPTNDAIHETLVLVYDGAAFTQITSPNPDQVNELYGAVVHWGVLWAVGTTGHEAQRSTLVLNNNCVTSR